MLLFAKSLQVHRAAGFPDDLGIHVCRDAFLALTGLGVSTLQAAREAALKGNVSWSSPAERGMHGGLAGNNSKAAAYLRVRQ